MEIDPTLWVGLGGAAVVAALIYVLRETFGLTDEAAKRLTPLASIILGIGWNALILRLLTEMPSIEFVVIQGIFTGLAASGTWSGQKALQGK